eukprot:6877113-Pyramimonas_sp.AAC.1
MCVLLLVLLRLPFDILLLSLFLHPPRCLTFLLIIPRLSFTPSSLRPPRALLSPPTSAVRYP